MSNVRRHLAVEMSERLFVYGTLAPGRPNAHILAGVAGKWEKGCVRGHLLAAGWGADQGYPGIVLDAYAKPVGGFVLTSDQLSQEWARLDEFEGAGYQRVLAQVELETGSPVQAYVYQLKR
jgi:gamma-glutamylcyclotransferase (GGCT)/AIG2-like uncharacterized protein YtfP